MGTVAQSCKYTENHCILHFELIVCELHLNGEKKKTGKLYISKPTKKKLSPQKRKENTVGQLRKAGRKKRLLDWSVLTRKIEPKHHFVPAVLTVKPVNS